MKNTLILSAAAALACASPVLAQAARPAQPAAAPAAAAAQPAQPRALTLTNPGPVIPGLCVVNNNRVFAQSRVGRAYQQRIQQLTAAVRAELTPEETAITTEGRALEQQRATLQPAVFQQRATALQTRLNALQARAGQRSRELDATEQRQIQRISTELQPVLNTVYGQRGCGVLLDGSAVVAANPAIDITQAVVTALDARISTITFERETLPQQTAAPAAR
jgi:outer membrane protein